MAYVRPKIGIAEGGLSVLSPDSKTVYAHAKVNGTNGSLRTAKKGKMVAVGYASKLTGIQYTFYYTMPNADGDAVEFKGDETTVLNGYNVQYSAPEQATSVRVVAKPVSGSWVHYNTAKKNSKTTTVTAAITSKGFGPITFADVYPVKPTVDNPTIENLKLTIDFTTTDPKARYVRFKIFNGSKCLNNDPAWEELPWEEHGSVVVLQHVETVPAGGSFRIQAQTRNNDLAYKSEWSDLTAAVSSNPVAPTNLVSEPYSTEGIRLSWDDVPGIATTEGYEIQYVRDKEILFDTTSDVTSQRCTLSEFIFPTLDFGYTYIFRVRALNSAGQPSDWSDTVEQSLAKKPNMPSIWTIDNICPAGSNKMVYWLHNSADNSKMQSAIIQYSINGVEQPEIVYTPAEDIELSTIFSYELPLASCTDGTIVMWKVKTKGVFAEYSDYSVERTIKVYSQPTMSIVSESTVTRYPIHIELEPEPITQTPLVYSIDIISNNTYERVGFTGESEYITSGQTMFSRTLTVSDNPLIIDIVPNDCKLDDGQSYTIHATVAMNSGFTATIDSLFDVEFDNTTIYEPTGSVDINEDGYSATITPICYNPNETYFASVNGSSLEDGVDFIFDSNVFEQMVTDHYLYAFTYNDGIWSLNSEPITDISTYGITLNREPSNDDYIYIDFEMRQVLDANARMSIYRREPNGEYVEIVTDVTNNSVIFDPHPTLGIAEYRIVAINPETGAMGFGDIYAENSVSSIIIQWDESYESTNSNSFEDADGDIEVFGYNYSVVELPYNVKTSESASLDSDSVKYIGRKHPVTYYGTQQGISASWSSDIDKTDTETINMLRKLMIWPEDVYVREPNGTGYWANVTVSLNFDYSSLIVPVSLNVTRVESKKI